MRLERNIHFPANDFDQIRGFASGLGIADDGLAVVDGQMTLHGDCDGASVVHVVVVVTVDNVIDVPVLDAAVFFSLALQICLLFAMCQSILFLQKKKKKQENENQQQ